MKTARTIIKNTRTQTHAHTHAHSSGRRRGAIRTNHSERILLHLLVVCFYSYHVPSIQAMSVVSPWAPATWALTLSFGRESGTYMPESWGASGGRLVVPCNVVIDSKDLKLKEGEKFDPFMGPGASQVVPASVGTYITTKGQQTLELSPGGWTLEFPPGGNKGLATKLRFWMDLQNVAERNDILLEKGERLYFSGLGWREDELEMGIQQMKPIQWRYKEAKEVVEKRLSHETGDRRLDGKDALETIKAYGDMTQLVVDRDLKRQQRQDALLKYPPIDKILPEGPWPGAVEWLSISKTNPILVARPSILGEEYHIVGTWEATPVLDGVDYEEEEVETN